MMRVTAIGLALASLAADSDTPRVARFPAIVDAGGCVLEQVTNGVPGQANFQFEGSSHDGRQLLVAWSSGNESGSYLLDLTTGGRREIPGLDNAGVFSRDGAHILVANSLPDETTDIVEYELASGSMTPVAPHPRHEFLATYSPDESLILFNSYRTGRSDIYVVSRDGGEPLRLTDFEGYEAHAAFSPDMKSILFHRNVGDGNYDIYRIDFASRAVHSFISGPGEQAYPSWSPDGRFVAIASDGGGEADKTDIYIADASGTIRSRITGEPGYNTYPSWSKDGQHLYFNSERNGARNVYRVAMDESGGCVGARSGD
jgi:TolB protein